MLLSDVSAHSTSSFYLMQDITSVLESAGEMAVTAHSAGVADGGSLLGWFWLGVFLLIVAAARPPKSLLDDIDNHH